MTPTLSELAAAVGLRVEGDGGLRVRGAAHPAEASADEIAVALSPRYEAMLGEGSARAALLRDGADWRALGLSAAILAPSPKHALVGLTARFAKPPHAPAGVHPTAFVDPSAEIGEGASIGPFVSIGPGARLGTGARILPHVSVAAGAELGDDALLHAGVRIGERVRIGDRFIAQPNAVIGGDGFSFAPPMGERDPAGRIHSLASVTIGDDVEMGAGATVDRGTLRDTSIGSGTKIDNLVQVGHNVSIGRHCLICAQAGIAGSARIGDRVVLGGQVGVADHLIIGDGAMIAASSGVGAHVPAGEIMMGTPAVGRREFYATLTALRRLARGRRGH